MNKWYEYANDSIDIIAKFCEDVDQQRADAYHALDEIEYEFEMSGGEYTAENFPRALKYLAMISKYTDALIGLVEDMRVEADEINDEQVRQALPAIKKEVINEVNGKELDADQVFKLIDFITSKHITKEQLRNWCNQKDDENAQYFGSDTYDPLDDSEC